MKKWTLGAVALCFLLVLPVWALPKKSASPGAQKVEVNGKSSPLEGYNIGGYNYFKLRDLAAVLKKEGVDFSLKGDHKEIFVNLGEEYEKLPGDLEPLGKEKKKATEKNMILHINNKGALMTREYQVYNILGYNYFKLRDMGPILGFSVDYDEDRNTALLVTEKEEEPKAVSVEEPASEREKVILGDERITGEYRHLIEGKRLAVVTNQTGINSKGESVVKILKDFPGTKVVAAMSPEHGLDGKTKAGAYVKSYFDKKYDLPVYSLYGKTRKPSKEMVKDIDVFVYDMQDIGARTYTYISTLNYVMKGAKEYGKEVIVLDRPNPLGGEKVEGFTLLPRYKTFVGVDEMPMCHGMTAGELALFFNRNIGCKLEVVPMKGWRRSMIWQDTNLPWRQTSPNIPTVESAFHYMATGIGDGTGFGQSDTFHWVGKTGLDSKAFAKKMNSYRLPGITFREDTRGKRGGVKLTVTDYHTYNPAKTGIYLLATAHELSPLKVPREGKSIPMFEKIWGSSKMGDALRAGKRAEEIYDLTKEDREQFRELRKPYLLYE